MEIGRYQRIIDHTGGAMTSSPSARRGSATAAARSVKTIVTTHTRIWGIPTRTRNSMRETSVVVRPTRSPVPADSTALSGRCTTRFIMRSRSSSTGWVSSAISRSETTGFLSLSRSTVSALPAAISRAR